MTDPIHLTRQELYDRVWSTPAWKLGPELGLSGRGLGKLCAREGIPVPKRGYWAKKQFGWKPTQTKLPARKAAQSENFTFNRERRAELVGAAARDPKPPLPIVPVPANLEHPHKLVKRAASAFRRAKLDEKGHLKPRSYDVLDLSVGPNTLERALRICDGLFRYLEERGATVRIGEGPRHNTEIVIGDVVFKFRIDEPTTRSDRQLTAEEKRKKSRGEYVSDWPRYLYTPKGKLRIRLTEGDYRSERGCWVEGRTQLEDRLGEVVVGIDTAVATIQAERVASAKAAIRRREAERREEIARGKRELEEQRRQALVKLVHNWSESQAMRAFVNALRAGAEADGTDCSKGTRFGRWLAWAERCAHDSNPVNWNPEYLPTAYRNEWAGPDAYDGED